MNFGQLNSYVTSGPLVPSVTVQFPADNIDPGPRAGRLPTASPIRWPIRAATTAAR
jgi:hypothetical protein